MRKGTMTLLVALLLCGCAGHARTTRVADVTKGDYYTNDEIKGLTQEERDRYCTALENQILAYHDEANRYQASADSMQAKADSIRNVNSGVTTQLRDLDNEIRQLRLARRAATTYMVKAGDTLKKISSEVYGTESRSKEIFEANKDRIPKEDSPLAPGTRLTIPAK